MRIYVNSVSLASALLMLACDGGDSTGPRQSTITEAALVADWKLSQTVPGGVRVNIGMDVKANHEMVLSQKLIGIVAEAPTLEVQTSLETWNWTLTNGVMASTKVSCQYADSASGYQLQAAPCVAPTSKSSSVGINGSQLTVVEGTSTYIFTK